LNNNIIAIIAISFIVVGSIWGIGNLIFQNNTHLSKSEGILLLMKDNKFNVTNPDIIVKIDQPLKISIANQDFRKHDFIVDDLNINTGYISSGQDFTTVIASNKSGSYRYYCSIHPGIMEGKIIVKS
jgi:heme/copper-type cytochrome/quinol oxidase subunit 2